MVAVVYTDTSHCPERQIAACGYIVLVNGKVIKHSITLVGGLRRSSDGEMFAILSGLQYSFLIKDVHSIQINTDYQPITKVHFKQRHFNKYPYAKEIAETVEIVKEHEIGITFNYVRGHSDNYYNNQIDKSARNALRQYLLKRPKG